MNENYIDETVADVKYSTASEPGKTNRSSTQLVIHIQTVNKFTPFLVGYDGGRDELFHVHVLHELVQVRQCSFDGLITERVNHFTSLATLFNKPADVRGHALEHVEVKETGVYRILYSRLVGQPMTNPLDNLLTTRQYEAVKGLKSICGLLLDDEAFFEDRSFVSS